MSIRYGLLALLEHGPRYGSQLRSDFESRTGATWPLNIGQVYTTLGRLERDGLVVPEGERDAKQQLYAITETGLRDLTEWYERPVDRTQPSRDELAIKLAMAVGTPRVNVSAIIQAQRRHTLKAMQDYTRLKGRALAAGPVRRDDIAWLLVLEQLIFHAEAEARWLDHCEARLVKLGDTFAEGPPGQSAAPAPPPAPPPEAAHTPASASARAQHHDSAPDEQRPAVRSHTPGGTP
jgi:DNA-binding PadR family transcriptional regulator